MISKFLTAKAWQLFALQFGLPLVFQIVFMVMIVASNGSLFNGGVAFAIFFPLILLLSTGLLFGWFLSVAIGLNKKLPQELKLNVKRFKIFFSIPAIYIALFTIVFAFSFAGNTSSLNSINGIIGLIVPLHLFSIFCIFYCLNFVAKTIKTSEVKRTVSFSDYSGDFFLIWFYPIGIWTLQPRINKLANSESDIDSEILDSEL